MATQRAGIEQLSRLYGAGLVAYLTRMLGEPETAREVSQETFAKLQQAFLLEEVQFPRALLFRIATNYALMHLRRRGPQARLFSGPDGMEEVPDERMGPERQVIADEIGQHVGAIIRELRPNLRDVFVMAHVQGRCRREIAAALGISERRLDKRMTMALKTCRQRLASLGIETADID